MIFTERTITIRNDSANINTPVILYRGDKNVEVRFTLVESPYKYSNRDSVNIIESTDAAYAQLIIKTPNDRDPIFGDITAVGQSNIIFVIEYGMIDEIGEVGEYDFQIRLFDSDQTSMVTLPEVVSGFIIKEPIAKENATNNITNSAIVDSAVVTNDTGIPTFVSGSYNKTTWSDGDVISKQKLNKMEDGIYETYELSKDNSSQIKENTNDLGSLQVKVDSLASGNPKGVYPTLNDLKNDYPSGNNNIYIVSEDGSWCYWNGTDWIKGGIYQGTVVADKSITPSKNVNTYMPRYKDLESYTTNNTETSLFITNIALEKGIMNLMCKSKGGSVTFFHLEKENDNTFNVIDKYTTTLIEGINAVLTNFLIKGNGNEYLGFIGNIQFKRISSNGYYELQNATSSQNTFSVPFNSGSKNFDFAIYETYENAILVDEILKKINENKVDDKINKSLSFPYGDTVIKDLSNHNYTCENRLYIPNIPVKNGYVKIHIKCTQNDLGYFYAFDKDTDSFIVKKVISQSLEEGENIIDMPYEFKGDGTEYIGFYTTAYYKTSGGTGFYESSNSLLKEGDSITPRANISNGFDFAVYYEYYNKNFRDSIIELKQDTKDLKTIINNIDEKLNNNIPYIKLTDFSLPKYSEIEQQVGFFGRWFEKKIDGVTCKCTINQGSELYFKVKGATKVDLIFKINTDLETPYFAYSIDGNEFTRQQITTSTINLPSAGEHIIRVVIDGITEHEYKWISEKSVAFEKAVVDSGTIKGIIPKNRKIIFYGDSITDGINVLNSSATANGNSAIGAFPFITCKKLNSISYRVGFGSTGVTKSGSGKVPKCLTVIDNMTAQREEQYIEPDLIVINHGTNDPKSTDEDSSNFINEYNQVLERLRIKYPGVPIFAVIPFRQFHADDIRACVSGKEWVYLIETQGWNVPYTDGVHPNVEGGKIAGEKLSLEILKVLGKDYFIK